MKAIQCQQYGPLADLQWNEIDPPKGDANELVIQVSAAGVNYPDGLLVMGQYQMKPPTPFTPGIEVAGTVLSIGENVKGFTLGQRVAALLPMGGYAEQVAVAKTNVMPLPDNLPDADACALLCAYGTAQHALVQRGQLQAGETLLVLGAAGATGIAAIQIAKAMGANVIAVASTEEKRALCREHGADHVLAPNEELKDQLKQLTKKQGVDLVFDPVGGDLFDVASRAMAWNGRYLVIGFASGTIPKLAANLALVKGFSLVGVFWGSFVQRQPKDYMANHMQLIQWYQQGKIKPVVSAIYPMENAAAALTDILERRVMGKIVLSCG